MSRLRALGWFLLLIPTLALGGPLSRVVLAITAPQYLWPTSKTFPGPTTTTVRLSWIRSPGAAYYRVQAADAAATGFDPSNNCGSGFTTWLCVTGVTATSVTMTVQRGHTYSWWVTAFDSTGANMASATAVFSVTSDAYDMVAPTVQIAWPQAGASVNGALPINVVATDDVGVVRVTWWVDATLMNDTGSPASSPYTYVWDSRGVANGTHTLTAYAYDAAGNASYTSVTINVANGTPPCIAPGNPSGDDVSIQAALSGPYAQAVLCQDSVYLLRNTVQLNAIGQQVYTQNFPTYQHRAIVRMAAPGQMCAFKAYVTGASLRNVELDGNRGTAPHITPDALIEFGGNSSDQFLDSLRVYDPRGWSAMHVIEGDVTSSAGCHRAVVTRNDIGPSGVSNPSAGDWADGLSLSCRDSFAAWNRIIDATDGDLVIFGSPGSRVTSNNILQLTRRAFGAIHLVPYKPYSGDYTGTEVSNNSIEARTIGIRAGIAMGEKTWACGVTDPWNHGARVLNNTLSGPLMGYGLVANGVYDWVVSGNTSTATHSGTPASCPTPSVAPQAFVADLNSSGYDFAGFVDGHAENVPWIGGPGGNDRFLAANSTLYGLSGAQDQNDYYELYVPPGTTEAKFALWGGSGDADLYVQVHGAPDLNSYACRPYLYGNNETCDFLSPTPGWYYVMLNAYSPYNQAQLTTTLSNQLLVGRTVNWLEGDVGTISWSFTVPQGATSASFSLSGGYGDADLYVKVGAPPTLTTYDCRPYLVGNNESCTVPAQGGMVVYVMVNAYAPFAGASLTAFAQ